MSAILARIHLSGSPVETAVFEKAFRTLNEYGPDGASIWNGDWCALGHQNTAVAPEPEDQPVFEAETVLVADAILDDRSGLVDRLGLPVEARSWPDSRLICAAVRRWGADCPAHLVGDFAFVAVDRARRTIIAARDPIGARPLFVHQDCNTLVLASDLRAFAAFDDIDTSINDEAVVSYLVDPLFPKNQHFLPSHRQVAARPQARCQAWHHYRAHYILAA